MITSKVWSAIRDIKNIYGFKFVLFDIFTTCNCQVLILIIMMFVIVKFFAEICDGQRLELTRNYRAENDVDFAEFIADLRIIIKNGGKPDFKTCRAIECRKSLCWTNKTRKSISAKNFTMNI